MVRYSRRGKEWKKVLSILKTNGRISACALGKKLNFSRQKAWHVITDLEKNEVIWGYSVVIDENKINQNNFIVLIKRTNKLLNETLIEKICHEEFNSLVEEGQDIFIESIFCVYGSFDWILIINASDIVTVKSFISNLQLNLDEYIDQVVLLESVITMKKNWIRNPEIEKGNDIVKKLL